MLALSTFLSEVGSEGVIPDTNVLCGVILNHSVNALQVAAEVIELLSLAPSDASAGLPAALGESVVLFLCHDSVGSGFLAVREPCRV